MRDEMVFSSLMGISQNFHNFGSTGPICTIFTFLEMASKFVGTSSSAEGRGIKIEAATAVHRFSFCHFQHCDFTNCDVTFATKPGQLKTFHRSKVRLFSFQFYSFTKQLFSLDEFIAKLVVQL